jgi:hypothetical protein
LVGITWEGEKVFARDQVLEVRNVHGGCMWRESRGNTTVAPVFGAFGCGARASVLIPASVLTPISALTHDSSGLFGFRATITQSRSRSAV